MNGVSVGQLLAMYPAARKRAIANLEPASKMALAHLTTIALEREIDKIVDLNALLYQLTAKESDGD